MTPRRVRKIQPVVAWLLLSWTVLVPGLLLADDELDYGLEQHSLKKININGNLTFAEDELKDILQISEPDFWRHPFTDHSYRPEMLEIQIRLLRGFYRKRGFHDVAVMVDTVVVDLDKGDTIFLGIKEGPRTYFDSVSFIGYAPLTKNLLREQISYIEGSVTPADLNHLGTDIYNMRSLFWDRGYMQVTIVPTITFAATEDTMHVFADLVYNFTIGQQFKVGQIFVKDNQLTRENLILREMQVETGDILDWSAIEQSRQNMLNTALFRNIDIVPSYPDSGHTVADLTINVVERKPAYYELGAGIGSHERMRGLVAWGHNNLWGTGRRLTLRGKITWNVEQILGNDINFDQGELNYRAGAFFTSPHVRNSRFSFDTNVFLKRETRGESGVTQDIHGFILGTNWFIGNSIHSRFGAQLKQSDSDIHELAPDWLKTQYNDANISPNQTRSLFYTLSRDMRNDAFRPISGDMVNTQLMFAGGFLGGDYNFVKWSGAWHTYQRLLGSILAFRVRIGAAHPYGASRDSWPDAVPYAERFFAGGVSSVRGYQQNSLGPQFRTDDESNNIEFSSERPLPEHPAKGGNFQLLTNVELRFPLPVLSRWKLSSVFFVDGGNVWSYLKDLELKWFRWRSFPGDPDDPTTTTTLDYRYSIGTGIRLDTPFGPFRIDVGFPLKRAKYEIPESDDGDAEDKPEPYKDAKWIFHFSLGYPF